MHSTPLFHVQIFLAARLLGGVSLLPEALQNFCGLGFEMIRTLAKADDGPPCFSGPVNDPLSQPLAQPC